MICVFWFAWYRVSYPSFYHKVAVPIVYGTLDLGLIFTIPHTSLSAPFRAVNAVKCDLPMCSTRCPYGSDARWRL